MPELGRHAYGMARAIEEARASLKEGGMPIGASLLGSDGTLLGSGHNQRVQRSSTILHAELDCLEKAGRLSNYAGATMYSTLMPCHMCAGAIVHFGIPEVVVGEARTFPGEPRWLMDHGVGVVNLDLEECQELLQGFITERPEVWLEDGGPQTLKS